MAADDLTAAQVPDRVHAPVAAPQNVAAAIAIEVAIEVNIQVIDLGQLIASANVDADADSICPRVLAVEGPRVDVIDARSRRRVDDPGIQIPAAIVIRS